MTGPFYSTNGHQISRTSRGRDYFLRTMSFVKSLNLEEKLTRLVDVPIPFVPKMTIGEYVNWV